MRPTEKDSIYHNIEKMSVSKILESINTEDKKVAIAINKILPEIEKFVLACMEDMKGEGRLFYIGAGTSGRLGILDASECPPTFGVRPNKVVGIIAGGDRAIRHAVEFAEDDCEQGWKDLKNFDINSNDTVVGIAASGTTPYVVSALKEAKAHGIRTACITANNRSPMIEYSDFPMVIILGPEFITGSTRMKAGTAQKMILNMISTSLMIKMGHIENNKMIDMQLSNHKLWERGVRMIIEKSNLDYKEAEQLLKKFGSVRLAIDSLF